MTIYYDKKTDSAYIELSFEKPDDVIEIPVCLPVPQAGRQARDEGLNVDTTVENKIVGIELLNASKKIPLSLLLIRL